MARTLAACLVGLIALGTSPQLVSAQGLPLPEEDVRTLARPGQPTITVYLWGTVGSPGVWRVERDMDLVRFLSVVQVPGIGGEDQNVRRNFKLRIYRRVYGTDDGDRREVYTEDVSNLLEGDAKIPPSLQDGDIIAVETQTRRKFSFRTVFEVVRTTASLLTLYFLIDDQVF